MRDWFGSRIFVLTCPKNVVEKANGRKGSSAPIGARLGSQRWSTGPRARWIGAHSFEHPRPSPASPRAPRTHIMAVTRAKDSEIKAAFQKFDKDNSGSLEIGELYDVLREIGLEITKEHFDGYSQIMMDDFDTDKSGALDYDEFTRFYEQVLVNESGKGQYKEMLELKEEGNTFFRSGDYLKAAATYTKAIKAAADHGIEK